MDPYIRPFKKIWQGGYYEGNPLEPLSYSNYHIAGYVSVLHAVYLTCIKPYVSSSTKVLEIGPGRGAWTKTFLNASEVWCLDALSAEHNHFWEYVGLNDKVKYLEVNDFKCTTLPNGYFNYLFSFGTFCHIPFNNVREYLISLYPKIANDANCFIMISDYDKYNDMMSRLDKYSIINAMASMRKSTIWKWTWKFLWRILKGRYLSFMDKNEDLTPKPHRWFHLGKDRMCLTLKEIGYKVINDDIGLIHRDPIIHFTK
jgi:hypothetical protein